LTRTSDKVTPADIEAIWSMVSKPHGESGHWPWLGSMRRCKGGSLIPWVALDRNRIKGSAAKFIWGFEGKKLIGTSVMHRACDEATCVNPAHWLPGVADQGPRYRPSKSTKAVVTSSQEMVAELVRVFRMSEETMRWHAKNWENASKTLDGMKARLDSIDASLGRLAAPIVSAHLASDPAPGAEAKATEASRQATGTRPGSSLCSAFEQAMGVRSGTCFDEPALSKALDRCIAEHAGFVHEGSCAFSRNLESYRQECFEAKKPTTEDGFLAFVELAYRRNGS
jgi:hypothetical protein